LLKTSSGGLLFATLPAPGGRREARGKGVLFGQGRLLKKLRSFQPNYTIFRSAALNLRSRFKEVTEEEIISFCRKNLSPYKVPKNVQFVEDFPRTATGKILKALK